MLIAPFAESGMIYRLASEAEIKALGVELGRSDLGFPTFLAFDAAGQCIGHLAAKARDDVLEFAAVDASGQYVLLSLVSFAEAWLASVGVRRYRFAVGDGSRLHAAVKKLTEIADIRPLGADPWTGASFYERRI